MQSAWLLSHFCKEVDKIARGFLWGSLDEGHGIHLVNWDAVTLPKYRRGLGLRMTRDNKIAMMGKLCWDIIQRGDKPWIHVYTRSI